MFQFLLKGLFRDRSRSLFPILIVTAGVVILVFTNAFMQGYIDGMIRQNSRFDTGHLKIVTTAYARMLDQKPYDLGFLEIGKELQQWKKEYPDLSFARRINFGALLDLPDSTGNTSRQGEVMGFGVDLRPDSPEIERLHLHQALVTGRLPRQLGEILISDSIRKRLQIEPGQMITLVGSTVFGAMSFQNFRVVGSLDFGVEILDRGGVIADLQDVQTFLDMPDGVSEILVYFPGEKYRENKAVALRDQFNKRYASTDEFAPVMLTLSDQHSLGSLLRVMTSSIYVILMVFIGIMAIVLWNSGLMNAIRRYGEFGVRLAMGEQKQHIYWLAVLEASFVGLVGSALGSGLGMLINWYFHVHGIDASSYGREASVMMERVIYTSMDYHSYLYGFITGVTAPVLGAMLAGVTIFKRQTSQLFKELET